MKRPWLGTLFRALAVAAMLSVPATAVLAADAIFPVASRIGMVPPEGLKPATGFPGFEDQAANVFVRLIALPGAAYAEIEKTMTNDGLKKQGMTVDKREQLAL